MSSIPIVDDGTESVVVVGAGIIGLACAHYLTRAGLKVVVVDQGKIGNACSHANCGYICPSHVPPLTEPGAFRVAFKSLFNPRSPFRVKPSLRPSFWKWMYQFAIRCNSQQVLTAGKHLQTILDASLGEYRRLLSEGNIQCEWEDKGLLYVFRSEHAMEEFARQDQMLSENFGVTAKRIESEELRRFEPGLRSGLAGAFHYPGDASVRPDLLNRSWTKQLQKEGVVFLENCEVKAIRKDLGRVVGISTSMGDLRADRFVFAMGAWSTHWEKELECPLPIQPGKGYSVTLEKPEGCPSYPMLFPEEKVGVSPFADGMRLGSMMEFVGYNTTIPAARIQQLKDAARKYLIASVDGEVMETWYGWRPMTWDSLPIIGRNKALPNTYFATGHNMLGLSLAPSTGRLISELVCGRKPHIDPNPYSPDRFR